MDEGMRRDSTDQIKEIEYQPSADSRLNEVNDSIQGPDWFIKMKENQIESSLQQMQLGRQLDGRDNNELQRYSITQSGVVKTLQDVPSVQYQVKINNFSVLQSSKLEKYETGLFEACNHKWKLSFYPNGNTNRGGKDHLSLYLEIATKNLPRGWKVEVNMKLLVYDHKRDKFWAFQDAIGCTKRFHHAKTEWGLDKLLPLCTFNDADNGFLADDSCVFGVELFLVRDTGEGESMTLVKDFKQATHRWTIDNLLEKIDGKVHSEEFSVGGPRGDYKWCISVYLNGAASHAGGKFMSVNLHLDNCPQVPRGRVYAEYKLRIKPQFSGKEDYVKEGSLWFCCPFHCPRTRENSDAFIDYQTLANSFLSGDGRRLVVEAEIMNIGLVEGFK